MYPLAIIRYRRPLEEVLPHLKEHRAYRQGLYHNGWLRASGPFQPRSGGAQYELLPLTPATGAGGLERIGVNP